MAALRIVGLGDSTTAGTPAFLSPLEAPPSGRGNPESQYAHWMMHARPDWTLLNRGINGQTSDEILARFARDVVRERADYVIVLAGLNDIYQQRRQEDIRENLDAMYRLALDARIVPVAATVLPYDLHRRTLRDRLRGGPPSTALAIRRINVWVAATARTIGLPFCDTNAAEQPGMRSAAMRARANHAESALNPYVVEKYSDGAYSNVHILPRSKRPGVTGF